MANRNFNSIESLQKKLKLIAGSFKHAGAGKLGLGYSVARTAVGKYTLTLDDSYPALTAAVANLQLASGDDKYIQWNAIDVVTNKTLNLVIRDKSSTDAAEITTVQCVADVAGSLNSKYFTINSADDLIQYYVWFNVNSAGVDPAIAGKTGLAVALATGANANTVAAAVAAVLDPLASFAAAAVTDTVTVTNASVGVTTDAANGTASPGFTINVTQQGDSIAKDIADNANNRINFQLWLNNGTID